MPSLTVRDIPDELLGRLRALSAKERRSLNSEILVVLEEGLRTGVAGARLGRREAIARTAQLTLWRELAGRWKEARKTADIVRDIRNARSAGREVTL